MYNYRKMIFLQRNAQHFAQNGVFCAKYKSFIFLHGTLHTCTKQMHTNLTRLPHFSLTTQQQSWVSLSHLHVSSVLLYYAPTMRALYVSCLGCLAPLLSLILSAMSGYLTTSLSLSPKSTTG